MLSRLTSRPSLGLLCQLTGAMVVGQCWRARKQTKLAAVTFCLPHRLIWGLKSDLHGENSAYDLLLLWQLPSRFTDNFLPCYFTLWPIYRGCLVSCFSSRQLSHHGPAHVESPCDKAAVVAYVIELTPVLRHVLDYIQGVPGGMDKTSGECSLCWTIPI